MTSEYDKFALLVLRVAESTWKDTLALLFLAS